MTLTTSSKMMKKILAIAVALFALILAVGCSAGESAAKGQFDISVYLPSAISIEDGGSYTFEILGGGPAESGDVMNLSSAFGKSWSLPLSGITAKSFDIVFPKGFVSGRYSFVISRGGRKYLSGLLR